VGLYAFGLGTAPAIVDAYVAARCPTQFFKCLPERRHIGLRIPIVFGKGRQHADAPHPFALLRPHRERPHGRTAEQRDERAPLHSITSSARASRVGGISRPRAFAVLRLMTSSNFVGCSTGKSAGLAP